MGVFSLGLMGSVLGVSRVLKNVRLKSNAEASVPVDRKSETAKVGPSSCLEVQRERSPRIGMPPAESITVMFTICRGELIGKKFKPNPSTPRAPKLEHQSHTLKNPATIDDVAYELVVPHDTKRTLRKYFEMRQELTQAVISVTLEKNVYKGSETSPHRVIAMRLHTGEDKSIPLYCDERSSIDRATLVRRSPLATAEAA